jgi:hypothetical protein
MVIGLWILVALSILALGAIVAFTSAGYRVALLSCVIIGLTPLGFVAGTSVPIFLPEILLIALTFGVLAKNYESIPAIVIPGFLFLYGGFFAVEVIVSILFGEARVFDLVRGFRPVAFIGLLLLLRLFLSQVSISQKVTIEMIALLIALCIGIDLIFYTAAHAGFLSVGGISGEYLSRTGLVRYSDLLTISLFGVSNYFVFSSQRAATAFFWLVVCGFIVALSLNRIFALGFLIAFSWWLGSIAYRWTSSRAVSSMAGVLPTVILIGLGIAFTRSQPEEGEVISRITELFNMDLLINALKYRFVDPALAGGYELTPLTFFFGDGFGLRFFIPWFEYRGLDPWHFSVDSLFAFAFFKFGVVGLSILCYSINELMWNRSWHASNIWIWLYLLVHSGINVPGFLLFLVVLVVLRDGSWLMVRGRSGRGLPLPESTMA